MSECYWLSDGDANCSCEKCHPPDETKPLTELFEKAVEFNDDALSDIHRRYDNDRRRYLAKNGVGLFGCGAAAEADRRKPIDLATKKLIEALEEAYEGLKVAHSDTDHWFENQCCPTREEVRSMKNYLDFASESLAEFRASLEDVE